jgi:hypothetical protein
MASSPDSPALSERPAQGLFAVTTVDGVWQRWSTTNTTLDMFPIFFVYIISSQRGRFMGRLNTRSGRLVHMPYRDPWNGRCKMRAVRSNRSFDADAGWRSFASPQSSLPVAGQLRR